MKNIWDFYFYMITITYVDRIPWTLIFFSLLIIHVSTHLFTGSYFCVTEHIFIPTLLFLSQIHLIKKRNTISLYWLNSITLNTCRLSDKTKVGGQLQFRERGKKTTNNKNFSSCRRALFPLCLPWARYGS